MINSYYSSVHSQHNESLICANIFTIYAYPYRHGRSATINTVVGINSVFPLVGWLGTNCFRLIPVTTWGSGDWGGLFMNIHWKEVGDMTWGGVSGVLKWATMFWVNLKVFPSLVVYNGILFLENYRIQVNPKKGKIVCCVAAVLNHHSILAIVFDVNCPHLFQR